MMLDRRQFLQGSAALAAFGFTAVQAQQGQVRMTVGFPPGGSGDIFARLIADPLREELGRTVIIDNKPGAGGLTAATGFLRSPKDGSAIMLHTGSTAISAPISRKVAPYNPLEDFTWIALLSVAPFCLAVNPALPVRDLKGLVDYAKANAGKLSYGHAGLGSTPHLATELFKDRTGTNIVDVPYQGSAPAITDTISGQVQFVVEGYGTLLPFHKDGKLRIIGGFGETRAKIMPELPIAREAGIDVVAGTTNLMAAPLGTSNEVLEPIARAIARVMQRPAIQQRLADLGIDAVVNSNPQQARAYVAAEIARWSPVVKKLGIAL